MVTKADLLVSKENGKILTSNRFFLMRHLNFHIPSLLTQLNESMPKHYAEQLYASSGMFFLLLFNGENEKKN